MISLLLKNPVFSIVILLLNLLFSCKSMSQTSLCYVIKNEEISDGKLIYSLKNTGSKNFSKVDFYAECSYYDSQEEYQSVPVIFSKEAELIPSESQTFSVDLKNILEKDSSFNQDLTACIDMEEIMLETIYITRIIFDDGTEWTDRYGTWRF